MHIFPATHTKHNKNIGSQTLTFEIDDISNELIKDLAVMPHGTPVLVVVYEIEEGVDPLQKVQENKKEMSNHFKRQIHAMVAEYAKTTGVEADQIKKLLKIKLNERDIMKKSLADMTETELSTAVFVLNTELNPSRFNYADYLKN